MQQLTISTTGGVLMNKSKKLLVGRIAVFAFMIGLGGAATSSAYAATFSFAGDFITPNDVNLFDFTLANSSTVQLKSFAYAGGTDAAGATIQRGGFDTMFFLYNGAGSQIAWNDDGGSINYQYVNRDIDGRWGDAYLQAILSPGSYTLALVNFSNYPNQFYYLGSLAAGFQNSGRPFDAYSPVRTSRWAIDLANVDSVSVTAPGSVSSVPVPAAAWLFGSGLVGLAGFAKHKKA